MTGRRRVAAGAVVVAAVAALSVALVVALRPAPVRTIVEPAGVDTAADFTFTIPVGTHARVTAGDDVDVFPDELAVRVGQVLRIVNDDVEALTVGPFYVGAGETVVQRFTHPGVYQGVCTVHADGQVVIRVDP